MKVPTPVVVICVFSLLCFLLFSMARRAILSSQCVADELVFVGGVIVDTGPKCKHWPFDGQCPRPSFWDSWNKGGEE